MTTAQRTPPLADKTQRMARNRRFRALGLSYRACSKCFRVKPLGAFPLNRSAPDGRYTYCTACTHAVNAARRSDPELRAAELARKRERWATDPELRAQRNAQSRDLKRSLRAEYARRPLDLGDGHLPKRCLPPTSGGCGQQLIRGDFNRYRAAADQRDQWCRDCKARKDAERYLMRKLDLLNYWDEIGALAGCYLCLRPFTDEITLHIEHVMPKALGGSDDRSNMLPACADCNLAKSAADPWDYLPTALADAGVNFWAAFRAKP